MDAPMMTHYLFNAELNLLQAMSQNITLASNDSNSTRKKEQVS